MTDNPKDIERLQNALKQLKATICDFEYINDRVKQIRADLDDLLLLFGKYQELDTQRQFTSTQFLITQFQEFNIEKILSTVEYLQEELKKRDKI